MSWNYRVIITDNLNHNIHEVYYKEDGSLWMYTENPVSPYGENLKELKLDLEMMLQALSKPALVPSDFEETEK